MNCKIFTIKSQTCRKRRDVTKFVKSRKTIVAGGRESEKEIKEKKKEKEKQKKEKKNKR